MRKIKSFPSRSDEIFDIRQYKCDICLTCRWFRPDNWINQKRKYNCYISFYVENSRYAVTDLIDTPEKFSCKFWTDVETDYYA